MVENMLHHQIRNSLNILNRTVDKEKPACNCIRGVRRGLDYIYICDVRKGIKVPELTFYVLCLQVTEKSIFILT